MERKAFTLIELLVVIAIIVLLVSILVPSLRKAKDLANRMLCMTMQRTHGLNVEVYASEHRDIYPASADTKNGDPMTAGYFSSFWLRMDRYYPGDATTGTPEAAGFVGDPLDKDLEIYNYICPMYRKRFDSGELDSLIASSWKYYPYLVGYETHFGNCSDPRQSQSSYVPWRYRSFGGNPKSSVGSCIGESASQVGGIQAAPPERLVMFNDYGFFKNGAEVGDAHPGGWVAFMADGHADFFETNNPGLTYYEYPILFPN